MTKRFFDLAVSMILIVFLSPLLILIALVILLESRGGIFYLQTRVGKGNTDFTIFKFRSMRPGSDKKGLLTIGRDDNRITRAGAFLRKYKLDELPQLFNVLMGTMSFVGPRPEVRKYVNLYTEEQKKVLTVKPGITDFASLQYVDENEMLFRSDNPEMEYISTIMPAKLKLNQLYIERSGFYTDIKIILLTVRRIFLRK